MDRQAVRRESRFVSAADGLRLHYVDYLPAQSGAATPVVCLPGLTRSAEDFERLAEALAQRGRRVLALDYRGRGLSDWDTDWRRYSLDVEDADILATLEAAGVTRAIFVGTSRGGIHIMRFAARRPEILRAAVVNDIGPIIDAGGLRRIKSYVGRMPTVPSLSIALASLKLVAGPQFPALSQDEWEAFARATFTEANGKLALRYDPELAHVLDEIGPDSGPLLFAEEWQAMAPIPTLVIRGGNSDLLSKETFEAMAEGHPLLERLTVEGQGHAPLLLDAPTIEAVADFVERRG
ncbi:alpha/beta fold hydrolase [Methylosinus sp. Sm6]|uniref:alpha/beta fold hydrolase n=1 Tax=Methylosinus sp. Sm6 TaxID=2866948 RepID=UPI001C99A839|nr:alpha/beta hydrolase [Methylosinus sp. Sm6]MBY6240755.1 alpha/beta hydrolase [Methylosinus sp. Sm6]